MEIINKNKLTDIKSVIFYKSDGTKLKLLHSGKSNQISLDNYSQYDFSYLFEKGKYNGNFLINDLDKESKELIGFGERDITEFEKVLFPSLSTVTTESSDDYDYFGYLLLGEQKFYMFDIIPNSKYIILCDTFLKDDTTIPEGYSNYLNYLKDTYCYIQLSSDEISAFRKTLSICLGKDEDPKINLMYQLFLNDNKNPFRNANKVYLRNDDYYKESSNIDIIKEKTYSNGSGINKVFKYDRNSDVLLSNTEETSEELLLYNRKKNYNTSQDLYDKHIRYNKGDLVIVNNERWISLVDNNLGNTPFYSSLWTREETLESIRLYRILISLVCNGRVGKTYNSGTLSKYGYVTLRETDNNLVFSITLENGFSFDSIKLDGRTAIEDNDFTKTEIITSEKDVITLTFVKDEIKDIYSLICYLKPETYSLTIENSNSFDFDIYINNELWIEPVTTEEFTQKEIISKNLNVFNEDEIRIVPKDNRVLNRIIVDSGNIKVKEDTIHILPQKKISEGFENISASLDIIEAICKITIDNDPRIIVEDKEIITPRGTVVDINFYSEDSKELYVVDLIKYTYKDNNLYYNNEQGIINVMYGSYFTITYPNSEIRDYIISWNTRKVVSIEAKYDMIAEYIVNGSTISIDFKNKLVNNSEKIENFELFTIGENTYKLDNDTTISIKISEENFTEPIYPKQSKFSINGTNYVIDWDKNKINDEIPISNNEFTIENTIYRIEKNNTLYYYVYKYSEEIEFTNNSFYLNAGILNKIDDIYTYTVVADQERVIELKVREEGEIV